MNPKYIVMSHVPSKSRLRNQIDYKVLAKAAKDKNLWLYSSYGNEWFSPEDLITYYEMKQINDATIANMKIADPMEAIAAGHKKVVEMQHKLFNFAKRVVTYYNGTEVR